MGLLIDGKWIDNWYDTTSTDGKFIRQESSFRNFLNTSNFPVSENRYHLIVSLACPWAHRTIIFRSLKGLEKIIGMSLVKPYIGTNGWELSEQIELFNNKKYLHEIYTHAVPGYTGRVTVPILWDTKMKTIVNNESAEIIRILNHEFNSITGNTLDYYPVKLRAQIDEINQFIYSTINNGVYKVGFSTQQSIYDKEVKELFAALDILEKRLYNQRYLIDNILTEADWRLFTTLVRFDLVYVGHFKCNIKRLYDYPNLSNYVKDLYQKPGIKETVNVQHIKEHYYTSHSMINPNGIIPLGPEIDYSTTHDRDRFE